VYSVFCVSLTRNVDTRVRQAALVSDKLLCS